MDQLVASGLSGSGLLPIRGPLLIDRYNECLKCAGIEPTALSSFDIDGKGWSPQIAAEKGNPFYLSHKGALQYAIILTPDQEGKPVYKPFYSFERSILDSILATAARAVADLTSRTGIWIEFDPGIVRFNEPRDLLLVESVRVTVTDPSGIMTAAIRQRALIDRFRAAPGAWSDASLRQDIVKSAEESGDLRFREVIIPPVDIHDLNYYYAEIFGGTFVLKNPGMDSALLVVADGGPEDSAERESGALHLADEKLILRLFADGFVEVPVDWYRDHPEGLEDLWESILVEALYCEDRTNIDFFNLTASQKKRYAMDLIDKLPKEFSGLERFLKKIQIDADASPRLSKSLRMMLMRPHRNLAPAAAKVVWRLITRMTTVSIDDLYRYDKPSFFMRYSQWPESRQLWAIEHLKQRGLCPGGKRPWL